MTVKKRRHRYLGFAICVCLLLGMLSSVAFADEGTESSGVEHTVSIQGQSNGRGSASPSRAVAGTEITLTPIPNAYWKLKEWVVVSPEGLVIADNTFIMPDEDVVVKPVFKGDAYWTVTFDSNRGSAVPSQTVLMGETATRPPDPVRAGYTLTKWLLQGPLTVYNFNEPVTHDIALLAAWERTKYPVSCSTTGNASCWPSHSEATEGTTITLTISVKEGYRLVKYQITYGNTTRDLEGNTFQMPGEPVSVLATVEPVDPPTTYTVTVQNDGHGSGTANPASAAKDTAITLTATPDEGYQFKEWEVVAPTDLVITDNTFTMPEGNVTVKAVFEEKLAPTPTPTPAPTPTPEPTPTPPPEPTSYSITVQDDGHGTGVANPATAVKDTVINLAATPDEGYQFKEWEIVSPTDLVITDNTFTMPEGDVTVKAIFEEEPNPTPEPTPEPPTPEPTPTPDPPIPPPTPTPNPPVNPPNNNTPPGIRPIDQTSGIQPAAAVQTRATMPNTADHHHPAFWTLIGIICLIFIGIVAAKVTRSDKR
ncbi:MAG: InlB B-repeat-containing protein [Lachnospiraceae bacterium]|nr:InlB B-repeat-containing protein [Lachnospiraceae bacterium]